VSAENYMAQHHDQSVNVSLTDARKGEMKEKKQEEGVPVAKTEVADKGCALKSTKKRGEEGGYPNSIPRDG